jgi:hypothetical protein
LRVLGISLFQLLLVLIWKPSRIYLGPSRAESNTAPSIWEVYIDEKGAHAIDPIVVMHEECSIISIHFELLIWREFVDVC